MMLRRSSCVAGLLLLLAGCYPQKNGAQPKPTGSPTLEVRPSVTSTPGTGCPASYIAPDPHRPAVTLVFDLSADRRTVTGHEKVRFDPDLPVHEVVFRLWPNGVSAPVGTSLTVSRITTAGAGNTLVSESLGAKPATQGTLITAPLGHTSPAGAVITADVTFTLVLPTPHFERWGSSGATAWWATGHPILAWERGHGWQRQPAVRFPSEATVSEAADTDITVTTPAGDTVLMTGSTAAPTPVAGGRLSWHATSTAARDVSVTVGHFTVRKATVAGVAVTVGIAPEVRASADELLSQTRRSIEALVRRYGPFPYPSLVVSALPGLSSGGIEYPGAIQVGPQRWDVVLPHEVAHEYFYGMVGDNQARDPWLDEAFATYSEALINSDEVDYLPALALPGPVDAAMASWGDDKDGYYGTIYSKGAAALLTARTAAGPAAFDAAMRCYVRANAWTVATPDDVARALAGLPAALAVLRKARAIP
ncbi:MAG: peptidase M1 [Pseudonocardiales bacterium]|nr:MAG: peptidase M1 [Pseudonocardiales bacterium]